MVFFRSISYKNGALIVTIAYDFTLLIKHHSFCAFKKEMIIRWSLLSLHYCIAVASASSTLELIIRCIFL